MILNFARQKKVNKIILKVKTNSFQRVEFW